MSKRDVDSLLCLNSAEKSSFEMLRLKNAKKSLNEILKTLEESIDSTVHDAGEDVIVLNSDRIPNSVMSSNSSAAALGDLIDVVSSTIKELKDISDKKKTNSLVQIRSEGLTMQADKEQPTLESTTKHYNIPENRNAINSRYAELFEIFSEESKPRFSNLQNFQRSKVNYEDAEVSSDKDLSMVKPYIKRKDFHQEDKLSENFRDEILPEKLSSVNFQNNLERLQELKSFASFREECLTSELKTLPIQTKCNLPNKLRNSKTSKEFKVSPRIKKRCYEWKVHENQSSSMIRRVTSSLENVPPLSSNMLLSLKTETSNSSLNSWKTLRDTPRNNNENNFSGDSLISRSIYELEMNSKRMKSGTKRGRLKLKTGDQNNMKKKKRLSSNVEKVQGDIELKKSKILAVKSDTKINNEEIKGKIYNGQEQKAEQNNILMDVFDILVEVESNLLGNRKLAESIQERFQDCSVLQYVTSIDIIKLLNEGISRYAMSIQNRENNRDLIAGTKELLMDSVLRLMEAVKGEREYLKQQECYYSKHFSELIKNNKKTGSLKRSTKHTLLGNDSLLSLNQKDQIEELISYIISLIKRIMPKNIGEKEDFEIQSTILTEKFSNRKSMSPKKTEVPKIQIEISSNFKEATDRLSSSKSENKRNIQTNFKNQKEKLESEARADPIFIKPNPEPLKDVNKYSSNEKFTRSSTLVLHGKHNESKLSSNQVIKVTKKGRCPSMTQPIWKPAGNAKVPIPLQTISRQKTRSIISTFDKKKEKQNDGLSRTQQSSRNVSAKESSIRNSKSQIQKSSINFKSSDLVKKSGTRFLTAGQKKETEVKSKSETCKSDLISKNQEENLSLNQDLGKVKRKSKQPEAIKILKELIKSTSEEVNKNDRKTTTSKSLETPECDIQVSVRYLKSRNKIDSSRSSLTSMPMVKQENFNKPSNIEFNIQKSKTLKGFEKPPLKNFPENKINLSKSVIKSKTTLNSLQTRIRVEEDKNRILKTKSARISNSESENSLAKYSVKDKINSACIINSKSTDIIEENKLEDKENRNVSLNSSRSRDLKVRLEHKEFQKPYLRKNANISSYLQSYIRMNSRQSLVSNNSCKSSTDKFEVKIEKSNSIVDTVSKSEMKLEVKEIKCKDKVKIPENEILESSTSKDLILFNFEPEQDTSQSSKAFNSCESFSKVTSSKDCQVSLESSICSRISENLYSENLDEVVETEINLDSDNQSSEGLNPKRKKKFVNKHAKPLLILKEILQQHGLDVDLVDEADRKLRLKQKEFSESIYLDKGDGTLLAVCSSKTLYDKLACLSDSSFEELEIKDAMNQCSLESFDQEVEISEAQKYFQRNETSLSSLSVKKSRSFSSICVISKKDTASFPERKVSVLSQTNFSSKKSEEIHQTPFVKNADTEIDETILKNLVYTDVEVSCFLENSIIPRKEASTEISFETFCYEVETQTKINPENDTMTDFVETQTTINIETETSTDCDYRNLEKDSNVTKEIIVNQKDILGTINWMEEISEAVIKDSFEINARNEKENSGMDSFLKNENFCKTNEKIHSINSVFKEGTVNEKEDTELQTSEEDFGKENTIVCKISEKIPSVDSFSKEETLEKKENTELQNFKEDSGKKNANVCKISEKIPSVNYFPKEETLEKKENTELQNFEEDSGKEIENVSKINQEIPVVDSFLKEEAIDDEILKEFVNSNSKEIIQEYEDIQKQKEEIENVKEEIENKSAVVSVSNLNFSSKSENAETEKSFEFKRIKTLEAKNNEANSISISESIPSFLNFSNSYEEIPISIYSSESETSGIIKTIQEYKKETNSKVKLISKLEITPSLLVFCNRTEGISTSTLSSKSKMKIERSKNTNFTESQNSIVLENFSESCKKIPTIKCSSNERKIFRECKSCSGKCRVSLNLSCPSDSEISESKIASELFTARNQNSSSTETISSDNNSLSTLIKYDNRQFQKFMVESQNRLSHNLAVAVLKLATKRARNLYEDVMICRQSLTSPQSWDSITARSLRGKMKCPFEESKKLEKDNLYLNLSAERKKEAKEILEKELNITSRGNYIPTEKILETKDFFQQNKPNLLTINISNFKSNTLKKTLQTLRKCETTLVVAPEIRDVMIYLLENVTKNLDKENLHESSEFNKRNNDRKNLKFQCGNQTFLKTDLFSIAFPIVCIGGAICFLIFWCLDLSI